MHSISSLHDGPFALTVPLRLPLMWPPNGVVALLKRTRYYLVPCGRRMNVWTRRRTTHPSIGADVWVRNSSSTKSLKDIDQDAKPFYIISQMLVDLLNV